MYLKNLCGIVETGAKIGANWISKYITNYTQEIGLNTNRTRILKEIGIYMLI